MARFTNRLSAWLVMIALGGVLAVLVRDGVPGFDRLAGREVNPCVESLRWRVGHIDPRFELSREELRESVETAIGVWETAAGRTFFEHDTVDGWPIELVYDDRQALRSDRDSRRERLEARDAEIGRREREHAREVRELRRAREGYHRRVAGLREEVRLHNATVERWNERGGAPPAVRSRLDDRTATIEAERAELGRLADSLERRTATLEAEAEAIERAIDELNALAREYGESAPDTMRSGSFSETVVTRAGLRVRTERRLTIYQFGSRSELVRVLTHELGHALGLDHLA
ncbi:MAG: hypothetical protein ACOC8B_07820, partial [Gemmatimonadota bacterium]